MTFKNKNDLIKLDVVVKKEIQSNFWQSSTHYFTSTYSAGTEHL